LLALNSAGKTSRDLIARMVGSGDPFSADVVEAYVDILRVAISLEEQVSQTLLGDDELYSAPVENIRKAIASISLDSSGLVLQKLFDQKDVYALRFIGSKLDDVESEIPIPEDVFDDLLDSLCDLITSLRDSEVSADLKEILVRQMEAAHRGYRSGCPTWFSCH